MFQHLPVLPVGILQMPLLLIALPLSQFLNRMVAEHMERTQGIAVGEDSELISLQRKGLRCYRMSATPRT